MTDLLFDFVSNLFCYCVGWFFGRSYMKQKMESSK